jgi:hypothetical protein
MKSSRPMKDVCAHKCRLPNSYYLGSAESPTSDSFSVWLKSSRSGDVASPPCSPQVEICSQTAQLIWAASLPYCTGLLYRHDLPKYSTFFLGKIKNLTRLISVLSLQFKFIHNHKSCFSCNTFEPLNRGRPCSKCNLNACRSLFLLSPFC